MSKFSEALEANRAKVAALLAFRKNIGASEVKMVTVRGVEGTWRISNIVAPRGDCAGGAWCYKQRDGADFGASRYYSADRLTPVV